ncbi:MAG TPA: hypothetical protein VN903_15820 [Polyangia bacterium]|nr:hypothetical protein [Polyangia bacterium]
MMRPSMIAIAALVATGSIACTHEHTFANVTPARAQLQRGGARRVAIIMDERLVHTRYETSTDGHTFVFYNAPALVANALQGALAGSVAMVQAFPGVPSSCFDAQVIPELGIEATGMLNHHCKVRFALTVADARGQPVVRRELETDETFVPVANGPAACEAAVLSAFNGVAYQALAGIDGLR